MGANTSHRRSRALEERGRGLFPNTIDSRGGTDDEVFSGESRGGHAHVILGELVGVEELETLPGFADIGAAVLVEAEDFPLILSLIHI